MHVCAWLPQKLYLTNPIRCMAHTMAMDGNITTTMFGVIHKCLDLTLSVLGRSQRTTLWNTGFWLPDFSTSSISISKTNQTRTSVISFTWKVILILRPPLPLFTVRNCSYEWPQILLSREHYYNIFWVHS